MIKNATKNQSCGVLKDKDVTQSDSKGHLTLDIVTDANKYYIVSKYDSGQIVLDPIPETELRILNDPEKYASLRRGIQQAETGKIRSLGSFKKYASK